MPFCKKCGTQLDDDAEFCHDCGTTVLKTKSSTQAQTDKAIDPSQTIRRDEPVYGVFNLENLPIGHVIDNRYDIKEKLGQGGLGTVYRVFDKKMNLDKALKIIPEAVTNDRRAMQNLRQEARTMIRLNHPQIVRVYDFHESGPVKYIDMEFIDGKSLNDLLLDFQNKRMPEDNVKELALQIAEGLAYAHEQNVIHRDIKPQNIMLNEDKKIKVMDFGIAETLRTSMSMIQNASSTGTLAYMAPEQIRGQFVGKYSDVFSFGATLYELLSGKPPFYMGDITYQVLNEPVKRIDGISNEFNVLLQKCLAKNYDQRYQNFKEVKKALGGKVTAYKKEPVKEESRPGMHRRLADVSILTKPDDAKVWINGKLYESEKVQNLKLLPGKIKIRIERDEYVTIEEEVEISLSESNNLYYELTYTKGIINVETEIPGQKIFINDEDTTYTTPYRFEEMLPEKYEINVVGDEFCSETVEIELHEGDEIKVTPDLIKYGLFKFKSDYKDLILDNVFKLKSGQQVKLKPGTYTLKPSYDYLPDVEFKIAPGEQKVLQYDEYIVKTEIEIFLLEGKSTKGILENLDNGKKYTFETAEQWSESVMPGQYQIFLRSGFISKSEYFTITNQKKTIDFKAETKKIRKKRKCMAFAAAFVLMLVLVICYNSGWFDSVIRETGKLYDIDGNTYKTVKIGNQVWMAENLKVTHYRNGDAIANVTGKSEWRNLTSGAYCNYDNNSFNVSTYGRLYNWYAVNDRRNIAPAGWHVPTDEEWKKLEKYIGMSQSKANDTGWRGTDEGGKMKERGTAHWKSPNKGATNSSGFTALPGGYRSRSNGPYNDMGHYGLWWSATELNSNLAWFRYLDYDYSGVYRYDGSKHCGFSVRLVRD